MIRSKKTRFLIIAVLSTVALLTVGVGGYALLDAKKSTSEVKTVHVLSDEPTFTFNSKEIDGWRDSGNQRPKLEDFTGGQMTAGDLEKVSVTISRNVPGESSSCMVSFYYWEKPLEEATALQVFEQFTIGDSKTLSLKKMSVESASVSTSNGDKVFQVHLYDLAGSGSSNVMKGVEFGVLPLEKGYIEVRGYCSTYEQLSTTLPIINAAHFKL